MNFFDILYVLLLVGFLALGFFQGVIRLFIALVAFYVSILLASLYFQPLGAWLARSFSTTQIVGQVVGFMLVLLMATLILTAAGLYTFRYARLPGQLDVLDRILGTLVSLVLAGFFLGILSQLLELFFVDQSIASQITFPLVRFLQSNARGSVVIPFFVNTVLPLIYATVDPILPEAANIIFRIR